MVRYDVSQCQRGQFNWWCALQTRHTIFSKYSIHVLDTSRIVNAKVKLYDGNTTKMQTISTCITVAVQLHLSRIALRKEAKY